MTVISLIAAVDEEFGLGKENKLLCHLPADLQHFKTLTLGKPIIMGRKTYQSIGRALPGRLNIVLSQSALTLPDATIVHSLTEALMLTADVPEVMIIGGAAVFSEALPLAQRLYLTRIHAQFDADVFFEAFDQQEWHCQKSIEHPKDGKNPFAMTFLYFERVVKVKNQQRV